MTAEDELNLLRKQAADLFLTNHDDKHATEQHRLEEGRAFHLDKHAAETKLEEERWATHTHEHKSHAVAHDREHQATKEAIGKAEESMERRLTGMNEFRDALRDQASNFVTRDMLALEGKDTDRRLSMLESNANTARGYILGVGAALGILVIIVNIALRFL